MLALSEAAQEVWRSVSSCSGRLGPCVEEYAALPRCPFNWYRSSGDINNSPQSWYRNLQTTIRFQDKVRGWSYVLSNDIKRSHATATHMRFWGICLTASSLLSLSASEALPWKPPQAAPLSQPGCWAYPDMLEVRSNAGPGSKPRRRRGGPTQTLRAEENQHPEEPGKQYSTRSACNIQPKGVTWFHSNSWAGVGSLRTFTCISTNL